MKGKECFSDYCIRTLETFSIEIASSIHADARQWPYRRTHRCLYVLVSLHFQDLDLSQAHSCGWASALTFRHLNFQIGARCPCSPRRQYSCLKLLVILRAIDVRFRLSRVRFERCLSSVG